MRKRKEKIDFIPCIDKEVTDVLLSSSTAIAENPANAPRLDSPLMAMLSVALIDNPQFIAVMTQKYWGQKGRNFGVTFLDNPTTGCKNKILAHMNAWSEYCNTTFRESSQGEIRIDRQRNGYWSYVGSDILLIPMNEATMNFQGFTEHTSEAEYTRVVRHETGHTLGCPHEHMRKEIIVLLDYEKTLSYFSRVQGWSRQTTISNVLTPLEERSIMASPTADHDSIMCYQLPGSITKDGKPIVGGTDITANDGKYMSSLYPKQPIVTPTSNSVNIPVSLGEVIKVLESIGYKVSK